MGAYIVYVESIVYLESVFQPDAALKDLNIERLDLCAYGNYDDDCSEFPANNLVAENAKKFLELDTYSLWYLTPIFNDEADRYFRHFERPALIPFHP